MRLVLTKWIRGFKGFYQVRSDGKIISVARVTESWTVYNGKRIHYRKRVNSRVLKVNLSHSGYAYVALCKPPSKKQRHSVHALVCEAFSGPKPTPRHEVNHKNGKKRDNRAGNLEWVTRSQNNEHAWDEGLRFVSESERKKRSISRKKMWASFSFEERQKRMKHLNGRKT